MTTYATTQRIKIDDEYFTVGDIVRSITRPKLTGKIVEIKVPYYGSGVTLFRVEPDCIEMAKKYGGNTWPTEGGGAFIQSRDVGKPARIWEHTQTRVYGIKNVKIETAVMKS